jgi:uncharacterized membrane protein
MTAGLENVAHRMKSYFITGLLAILPLLLTIFVMKWIAGTLNGYIGPRTLIGQGLQTVGYKFSPISNLTLAYFLGILLLMFVIFALGVLLESGARKTLSGLAGRTIQQLPLVRAIYQTTDKFVGLMATNDADDLKGMRVVYVRFGNSEWSPGTLALMPSMELFQLGGRDHWIVIIPTAPIPVGGAMIFAPVETVFATDMSMDAFAGSFVSLGVSTAPFCVGESIKPTTNQSTVESAPAVAVQASANGNSPS